jgi:hypothetical protein
MVTVWDKDRKPGHCTCDLCCCQEKLLCEAVKQKREMPHEDDEIQDDVACAGMNLPKPSEARRHPPVTATAAFMPPWKRGRVQRELHDRRRPGQQPTSAAPGMQPAADRQSERAVERPVSGPQAKYGERLRNTVGAARALPSLPPQIHGVAVWQRRPIIAYF